ncbi:MAG: DUF2071 domain-containing protein [Planctomycetes bacterium]|nr:DUF2071 domain-containing protein [Planctomycetota bacterium]MBI3848090.1 DUF2071 domain-containing protein [Planctomycetota bacterium]
MSLPSADHRPWPLPREPWVMAQRWHDLLFAHWPVSVEPIRRLVPAAIDVDTWEGDAWLGVVPFHMSAIRRRGLPPIPGLARFPELNVRTYVRVGDRPGVWFFSLDARNRIAVEVARRWYHLPYFHARMRVEHAGSVEDGWIAYESRRVDRRGAPAELRARYRPSGDVVRAAPGSLAAWLTERYCLYAVDRKGALCRGEIHHARWPLQPAEAEIDAGSMAFAAGLTLPARPPLLHFARQLDVVVWPLRRVSAC